MSVFDGAVATSGWLLVLFSSFVLVSLAAFLLLFIRAFIILLGEIRAVATIFGRESEVVLPEIHGISEILPGKL